jgi:insertion element IS1 protein InsB
MQTKTREIVGYYIGDHSAQSAQKLWDSLPGVYRQCAMRHALAPNRGVPIILD